MLETKGSGKYERGWKYCSHCRLFIRTKEIRCPFCHKILRTGPRKKRNLPQKMIDPEKYDLKASHNIIQSKLRIIRGG